MEKIYCELHLFDLYQTIYTVDMSSGTKTVRGQATMEELPAVIAALSNELKHKKVLLAGNSVLGKAVGEDIITYAKKNYNWSENEIEVEVLK